MKYLNYAMPLFKKAIKRNNPKIVFLEKKILKGVRVYEFWFSTQKAIISYVEPVKRSVVILSEFLTNFDYCAETFGNDRMEFIKYEQ